MKLIFAFIVYNVTLKTRVHRDILFLYLLVDRQKILVLCIVFLFFFTKKTVAADIEHFVRCNRDGRGELWWIL